jgi:hypothetical protein
MNPQVVHFYFPIFGTLFVPIDNWWSSLRSTGTGWSTASWTPGIMMSFRDGTLVKK